MEKKIPELPRSDDEQLPESGLERADRANQAMVSRQPSTEQQPYKAASFLVPSDINNLEVPTEFVPEQSAASVVEAPDRIDMANALRDQYEGYKTTGAALAHQVVERFNGIRAV